MKNNINLSPEAANAIEALRHNAGTLKLYLDTLTRIFNQILHTAEDMGMDDLEALETLRTLDMLRRDITAIATEPRPEHFRDDEDDEDENVTDLVDADTFDHK